MDQEGNIYQGNEQSKDQTTPSAAHTPGKVEQTSPAQNLQNKIDQNGDEYAINKLISMGIILLSVSAVITVFYLFSASQIFENFPHELGNISLPF